MTDRAVLYLRHMRECLTHIASFTSEGRPALDRSEIYFSILRNLQTFSESTKRLPADMKQHYPHIDWTGIAGFRNVLVHDYLGEFDRDKLWDVIVNKLPALDEFVRNNHG
jgi:uncharacterized protein with HEPN domain